MTNATRIKPQHLKKPATNSAPTTRYPAQGVLNTPPEGFLEYVSVVYGLKGIGKTTLCASMSPNTLVLMLEPRRRNLAIRMHQMNVLTVPELEAGGLDCWKEFKAICDEANSDPSVDTLVIDTIDQLYDCCLYSVCAAEGVEHPGNLNDYGAMWGAVKSEFNSTLQALLRTDMGVIFTSHSKELDIEINTGNSERTYGPSCSGAAEKFLKQAADFAFFYGMHGTHRAIHFRYDSSIWTACGVDNHFMHDGRPI